jgi:hypothetical protein
MSIDDGHVSFRWKDFREARWAKLKWPSLARDQRRRLEAARDEVHLVVANVLKHPVIEICRAAAIDDRRLFANTHRL